MSQWFIWWGRHLGGREQFGTDLQKDTWLALAEASPESFAAMAEQAKKSKSIELGESGSGEGGASDSDATPSVNPKISQNSRLKSPNIYDARFLAVGASVGGRFLRKPRRWRGGGGGGGADSPSRNRSVP